MSENELFGEEDILNHSKNRSFQVVCSSQSGELVIIKKRDFYQKILDSEQTKKIIKFRNKQKNISTQDRMKEFSKLINEYKQYIMSDFSSNIKQVNSCEYLKTTNNAIKQSGLSELLPLSLNQNLIQRFKTGQDQQTITQQYLDDGRYERINLKKRIMEKVNQVTNINDQANLLLDYVNNYSYAEPFGVVQIQFNRTKPQPRQQFLERVQELQDKQEKLRIVLRKLQKQESHTFLKQGKVRSISSNQSSINQKIIHKSTSDFKRQHSFTILNESCIKQTQDNTKQSTKRSISYDVRTRTSEDSQEQDGKLFQTKVHKYGKLRSTSQFIGKSNSMGSDEDLSPKKTQPSERESIRSSDVDKSLRNTLSNFQKSSYNQNNSNSEFKQVMNNIVRISNNYEIIPTHQYGFPIRIKTQNCQRESLAYRKLNSTFQMKNTKISTNPMVLKINKNTIPLIKNFNKIHSCLGISDQ